MVVSVLPVRSSAKGMLAGGAVGAGAGSGSGSSGLWSAVRFSMAGLGKEGWRR